MNAVVVEGRTPKRDAAVVPVAPSSDLTPQQMVSLAVSQNADPERLKALMDLQERWEKNEARKAFVDAMAAFKAEPIKILKKKDVNIPGGAKFKHAVLADVVDGSVAYMSKHGLSHNWLVEQTPELVTVTCVVTHKLGHSERTMMQAAPDNGPGRNKIQAVGSTITYLQRYTLMSLLGLAAKDMDNDGATVTIKKEQEPDGFSAWADNFEAVATDGQKAFDAYWAKADPKFRRYTIKFEEQWFNELRAKAKKVPA